MLADLDQKPLHNSVNFEPLPTVGVGLWVNLTAMTTSIALFLCPSDTVSPVVGYGRNSYRFNYGPSPVYGPGPHAPSSWDGPFTVHRTYRPADFRDGLSQTIGLSEHLQGDWTEGRIGSGDYLLTNAGFGPAPNDADQAISLCSRAPPSLPHESRGGESWFLSGYHFTGYNHATTPNAQIKDCSYFGFTEGIHWRTLHAGVFPARSHHTGGVQTLSMEAAVRFVSNGVNPLVWRAVATRSGAEVISSGMW
jgi:hypothetical protein